MHQMGSHGPAYFKRSCGGLPKVLPECTNNSLQSCTPRSWSMPMTTASSIPTILLASSIQWLKAQAPHNAPALLYVADHGESLGEQPCICTACPTASRPTCKARAMDYLAVA